MRTITELIKNNERVYVMLPNKAIQYRFLAYVSGWASNVYYNINKKNLITVDYEKYIDEEDDYIVKNE